jgi:hypothetical protein
MFLLRFIAWSENKYETRRPIPNPYLEENGNKYWLEGSPDYKDAK